jgi:hypothetical protein
MRSWYWLSSVCSRSFSGSRGSLRTTAVHGFASWRSGTAGRTNGGALAEANLGGAENVCRQDGSGAPRERPGFGGTP